MTERLAAPLEQLIDRLVEASNPPDEEARNQLGEELAKLFRVKPDEVAILAITRGGNFLQFIMPQQLRTIGTIPLNSTSALAARTARDRRAEANNNFSTVRHASVFEGVPMGRKQGELIHKIMSAPIVNENKVVGVVQISRKGHSTVDAGQDFSQRDLRDLVAVSGSLGRFVLLFEDI
ncbi:MAG: hypothetical protein ACLP1Y_07925 [Candidatus Acidiferrales bacterium]